MKQKPKEKFYVAYGSNLNICQMQMRCPTAKLYAVGEIRDYELQFKGMPDRAFATIAPQKGSYVPAAVWKIQPTDDWSLDRYSTDPEHEGYLTKKGLEHIKSTFATEIFRHELDSIYQAQTKHRDELTKIARDEITELVMRIQNGICDNPKLIRMMQELAEKIKTLNGKKVYAFLPPEVKSLVNEITNELCEDEDIKRLYDLWYESKYAILKSYTKHLPPQKPLSQEETFKPIRNAVIREALKLSADQQMEDTAQRVSSSGDTKSSHLPVTAITRVMKDASRIIEDSINGQLTLHPELAVDSKLRREIAAKKRGIQLRM